VIERSGLIDYHKAEKGEKGQARVENLQELVSAARTFETPRTSCRRWPLSSTMRRWKPAIPRPRSSRTACS